MPRRKHDRKQISILYLTIIFKVGLKGVHFAFGDVCLTSVMVYSNSYVQGGQIEQVENFPGDGGLAHALRVGLVLTYQEQLQQQHQQKQQVLLGLWFPGA